MFTSTRGIPNYPLDLDDLLRKNQRLQRRIYALKRKYAVTYKQLEEAREALRYYANPLPILQIPRENRDQIFTYAFQGSYTSSHGYARKCECVQASYAWHASG